MTKLNLVANPTFSAKVGIPVAGGETVDVVFTFRHRTKSQLDEFCSSRAGKSDTESFLEMVSAWNLEDEFNPANVELLLENYIGAAMATFRVYVEQLVQAKVGN